MAIFQHVLLFLLSAAVIWFLAGVLVDSIDRVAKRFKQSGFTIAFFVLGLLTSISEISVMVNSSLEKIPQVSAGNLAGASFVILLFIVPLLAILGNGVKLRNTLHRTHLAAVFVAIALPNLFMLDGYVTKSEGVVCLLAFVTLAYLVQKHARRAVSEPLPEVISEVETELVNKRKKTAADFIKIMLGGILIFLAGHLLVQETAYFSNLLSVPSSIIGLLLLSFGTNVPELVIAIRSVLKKHKDIAFGDYLGSSLINTPTFGLLALFNGTFSVESGEFLSTSLLLGLGLIVFFISAQSKNDISKREGIILISFYGLFLLIQIANLIRFATD